MKQTRLYIITALCLQMVLGAILLSCSTENDEYKKDSPSAENPVEHRIYARKLNMQGNLK